MTDDINWTDESKDWKALAWQYRDEIIRMQEDIGYQKRLIDKQRRVINEFGMRSDEGWD